eukprot:TRINITY_DN41214_c0_g1_i1.p1 TRINITY_DN41214_c0_g1~~TRINITY_DN41214_c0_g1_i1.p1  ORF type:complete len:579 (+),score=52.21 TRINITY_DN41214_c0_g1_i1:73-1737(+)
MDQPSSRTFAILGIPCSMSRLFAFLVFGLLLFSIVSMRRDFQITSAQTSLRSLLEGTGMSLERAAATDVTSPSLSANSERRERKEGQPAGLMPVLRKQPEKAEKPPIKRQPVIPPASQPAPIANEPAPIANAPAPASANVDNTREADVDDTQHESSSESSNDETEKNSQPDDSSKQDVHAEAEEALSESPSEMTQGEHDSMLKQVGGAKCPGPLSPAPMSHEAASKLKDQIKDTTRRWGYFSMHAHHWHSLRGKHVLDVGMGQGPIGIVAIAQGVSSYVGLDPAICLDRKARSRNYKIVKSEKGNSDIYQVFPYTGLQIMSAYRGKVILLPGTFEAVGDSEYLKKGRFDVVTMWSVTEHLPDNALVLAGIARHLKPGQALRLSHHNYYAWDGHHEVPKTPSAYNSAKELHRKVGYWGHLDPDSFPAQDRNLNRIRLGDLIALTEVYFVCSWKIYCKRGVRKALLKDRPGLWESFSKRGFEMAELLVTRWDAACKRREQDLTPDWTSQVVVHHPPLDGSYTPRPLPRSMVSKLKHSISESLHKASGAGDLVGLLR